MTTNGGGWTLVWKHSYMESLPLSTNMYYFSDYYKCCTTHDSGWCNIPNRKIVAYRRGTIIYAYKGIFNHNIDHDWTGGVLVDFKKIVDKCTNSRNLNVQQTPSSYSKDYRLLGLAFDKVTPYNYFSHCDTLYGTFDSPGDCQWGDCTTPSLIQQTMAIYVC